MRSLRRIGCLAPILVMLCLLSILVFPVVDRAYMQDQCHNMFPQDTALPDSLNTLLDWHEQGDCGKNIGIGIISSSFPVREAITDLINAQHFQIAPDQEVLWRVDTSDSRTTELVKTLNVVAPEAEIYFYYLNSASDFIIAADWMEDQQVNIITNLVAHPTFSESQLATVSEFMNAAESKGILWLNSAGNYGNSYYEADLDWSLSGREGWHYFGEAANGLMPFRVVAYDDPFVSVYVIWDDPEAEITVSAFGDPQTLASLPVTEKTYDVESERAVARYEITVPESDQLAYLALIDNLHFLPDATRTHFRIYLVNAIIESLPLSGNSIPKPNDNPQTLTIGSQVTGDTKLSTSRSSVDGKPELLTMDRSLVIGSNESGTGFSTLIVAGVAATYWSQNPTFSVSDIRQMLLADRVGQALKIVELDKGDDFSWQQVAIISVVVLFAGMGVAASFWRRDRRDAIHDLEASIQSELSADCKNLSVSFELSVRRDGFPRLRRFFRAITLEIYFDPRLRRPPEFGTRLADLFVHSTSSHSIGIEGKLFRFGHSTDTGYQYSLIDAPEITEQKAILGLRLNYRFDIRLPVILSFEDLVWDTLTKCPDEIQITVIIWHHEEKLVTRVLRVRRHVLLSLSEQTADGSTHRPLDVKNVTRSLGAARKVFVSYSSDNREFVKNLVGQLRDVSSYDFWVDYEQIKMASFWDRNIQEALDLCDTMLLILTPEANASNEVAREWNYFLLKNKPLLVLTNLSGPEDIHYRLSPSQLIFY